MAMVPGKASLPVTFRSGFRPKLGDSLLGFPEGRERVLNELLETPPDEFGRLESGRPESALRFLAAG